MSGVDVSILVRGCFWSGVEVSPFVVVDCLVGVDGSCVVAGGSLRIFEVSIFVAGDFFSDAGVSFLTAGLFLGFRLLVSKEASPNDLYPRKIRPLSTGIDIMPPMAISNSFRGILLF